MSKFDELVKKHKELSKKQDLIEDKQEYLSEALNSAGMEDLTEVSDELVEKQKLLRRELDNHLSKINEKIDISEEQMVLESLQDAQKFTQQEIEKALNKLKDLEDQDRQKQKAKKEKSSDKQEGSGQGQSQGQGEGSGDQLGSGEDNDDVPEVMDNHEIWETSPASAEEQKNTLDAVLAQALSDTERSYGSGSIPTNLRGLLDKTLAKPKINWKNAIRGYLGRCLKYDSAYSRKKPNRKLGFDAPGKVHAFGPKVLWLNDVSGSVSDSEYLEFFSEFKGMAAEFQEHVEVGFFDDAVFPEVMKLDSNMKRPPKRPLSGGTNFQAAIDYAKTKKPDLLIILTDGAAPPPTKPKFPVLWVICGGRDNPELFGKRVLLELDGNRKNSKIMGSND